MSGKPLRQRTRWGIKQYRERVFFDIDILKSHNNIYMSIIY